MKTPEEMAEEYADRLMRPKTGVDYSAWSDYKESWLKGYKAGQKATWEEWRRGKLFENDEDAKAAYKEALEDK